MLFTRQTGMHYSDPGVLLTDLEVDLFVNLWLLRFWVVTRVMQSSHTLTCCKDIWPENISNHRMVLRMDMMNDSQDGKAICKHCNKQFASWASFKFHIQNQICNPERVNTPVDTPAPDSDDQAASAPRPPPNSNELGNRAYAIAQSGDYELAKDDQAMCTYLTQHCVLCNMYELQQVIPPIIWDITIKLPFRMLLAWDCRVADSIMLWPANANWSDRVHPCPYVYCLHTAGSLGGAAHHWSSGQQMLYLLLCQMIVQPSSAIWATRAISLSLTGSPVVIAWKISRHVRIVVPPITALKFCGSASSMATAPSLTLTEPGLDAVTMISMAILWKEITRPFLPMLIWENASLWPVNFARTPTRWWNTWPITCMCIMVNLRKMLRCCVNGWKKASSPHMDVFAIPASRNCNRPTRAYLFYSCHDALSTRGLDLSTHYLYRGAPWLYDHSCAYQYNFVCMWLLERSWISTAVQWPQNQTGIADQLLLLWKTTHHWRPFRWAQFGLSSTSWTSRTETGHQHSNWHGADLSFQWQWTEVWMVLGRHCKFWCSWWPLNHISECGVVRNLLTCLCHP